MLFAIDWDDNQEELRVCIDGKQRCSSIMNFMNGVISFRGADKVRYYYKIPSDARKRTGQLLPPALRRQFDMKNLFTVEYENLTLEQQRDIFRKSPSASSADNQNVSNWACRFQSPKNYKLCPAPGRNSLPAWQRDTSRRTTNWATFSQIFQ